MRSMTGFGRGEATAANAHIVVEIKTVNHRFLEIRTKMPAELGSAEPALERCVRNRLGRGYCTVHLTFEHNDWGNACIAEVSLENHIRQLKAVAERTNVPVESLLPLLAGAPNLFEVPAAKISDEIQDACLRACDNALNKLILMRETEGTHMTTDVQQRIDAIENLTSRIQSRANALANVIFDKYHQKISEILSSGQTTDNARIETEAAIFAEKADINEEINRLFSHINQMRKVFDDAGPVGRRMDFLVQEMGREANTIASKSVLSEITHMVVSIKGELEKIRELIQNIE